MKENLRKQILFKRNQLSPEDVHRLSKSIVSLLVDLNEYKQANSIMLYLDFKNEVKTDGLIRRILSENKRALIPVTNPTDYSLVVSELKDPAKDLFPAKFGLREPNETTLRPVSPDAIDLVLVPGLVFDSKGYRIGFGAGYYDRFLPSLRPDVPLISMLFEFQLVEHVPNEPYDVPVHLLVTEKRIIQCR